MSDDNPTLPYPKPSDEHPTLVVPDPADDRDRKSAAPRRRRWPWVVLIVVVVLAALVLALCLLTCLVYPLSYDGLLRAEAAPVLLLTMRNALLVVLAAVSAVALARVPAVRRPRTQE